MRMFLFLSLLLLCSGGSQVIKKQFLVDYSFQPHLFTTDKWIQSLRRYDPLRIPRTLQELVDNNGDQLLLDLDVSSCCLGDAGIVQVVQALSEILPQHPQLQRELQQSTCLGVALHSNMNRLTHQGASTLIEMIITQQQQTYLRCFQQHMLERNITETNRASDTPHEDISTSTDNNVSTTLIYTNTTSILPDSSNWTFYIHELDLGFNDLGGYHHNHNKQQRRSNAFFKSIRNLLEDELGTGVCPTILRLDACGLGPQACRSIAKVLGFVCAFSFTLRLLRHFFIMYSYLDHTLSLFLGYSQGCLFYLATNPK